MVNMSRRLRSTIGRAGTLPTSPRARRGRHLKRRPERVNCISKVRSERMKHFDAVIIGTGQAGPSLAARFSAAGKTVAIIERHKFGGTCVNTGCIPTKTMVASAYAAHVARRGVEYGFSVRGDVHVDMKRVKARKDA